MKKEIPRYWTDDLSTYDTDMDEEKEKSDQEKYFDEE